MLGRRILRIKAFKAVYSLVEDNAMELKDLQRQFDESCQSTRDLYLFMLSLPYAVTQEAQARIESLKAKFHPTEEERNPNMKFALNQLSCRIVEDPDYAKILAKKKFSWENSDVLLRHLYDSLKTKDYYKEYMSTPGESLSEDAKFWTRFYEEELVDSQELSDILEDMNVWWNDDLAYALTVCCHTLKDFAKGIPWSLPELYLSDGAKDSLEDDRAFCKKILANAVGGYGSYVEKIASCTKKWDSGRICATDLALIITALSEHKASPATASNIIINEYVEISKYYSTPESKSFVNGILDKLLNDK